MTYEKCRQEMLSVTRGGWFRMTETVPDRPLEYTRPTYELSGFIGDKYYSTGHDYNNTSWKRALNAFIKVINEAESEAA